MLPVTDGEYDMVEYANVFRVHHQLSKSFDVSINGSFGELARGYWWELLFPNPAKTGKLDGELVARKRYTTQLYDERLFEQSKRDQQRKEYGVLRHVVVGEQRRLRISESGRSQAGT